MKPVLILLIIFLLMLQSSCSWHITAKTGKPAPYRLPSTSHMMAGVGQADLTAPPGYPMSGYSINGRIARGYWVRPKTTAFYFCDTAGTPFVFVTTDLWAIADGLKLGVLEALGRDSATAFIGESELLLTAVHSHHTIGINVPDDAFALTSIGFGFDRKSFDFTVGRIAAAIKAAVLSAKPAAVSFGTETVRHIAKNRSVNAYRLNNAAERRQYFAGTLATDPGSVSAEELESMIDQRLSLITIKDADGKIRGMMASYPVHPTATGDATEVYSADIFGLASDYASRDMADHPLIGFYNGAEGDVAPAYKLHNRYDAVRIATELSKAMQRVALSVDQTPLNGKISHRTNTIKIASREVAVDPRDTACFPIQTGSVMRTAKKVMLGPAVFAGASDGRTSLSSLGICEGVQNTKWNGAHGNKMPVGEFLTGSVLEIRKPYNLILSRLLSSKATAEVPISIHQVGNLYFAGLPGEFTTMLGRRIKKTIANQFQSSENAIALVGLADAYLSYVTTPCEYTAQAYEGASTYFGVASGQVFVKEYESLAQRLADKMEDRQGRKKRYKVGLRVTSFGPPHLKKLQTWDAEERLHNLLVANDGTNLRCRMIPAMNATDTIRVASDEAVAFCFNDVVTELSSDTVSFYPAVSLKTITGESIPMPEHILTLDKYSADHITWTVRILDMSRMPEVPVQIVVAKKEEGVRSAYFFRK